LRRHYIKKSNFSCLFPRFLHGPGKVAELAAKLGTKAHAAGRTRQRMKKLCSLWEAIIGIGIAVAIAIAIGFGGLARPIVMAIATAIPIPIPTFVAFSFYFRSTFRARRCHES
jgi:ABC-type nitrate/sulfonate/bicarbonate transport system permease component